MRDFSPSGAAGPSKLHEMLLAGAKACQKVAEQPSSIGQTLTRSSVNGFVSGAVAWSMLQFKHPEKRRQALRGRNLPRDIRAEVRQGAQASKR
jgi:hypothetical protein